MTLIAMLLSDEDTARLAKLRRRHPKLTSDEEALLYALHQASLESPQPGIVVEIEAPKAPTPVELPWRRPGNLHPEIGQLGRVIDPLTEIIDIDKCVIHGVAPYSKKLYTSDAKLRAAFSKTPAAGQCIVMLSDFEDSV